MKKQKTNNIPKIHLACNRDTLRPAMCCVYIKNGIASATNAHILAQMDLATESSLLKEDIELLDGKLIHYNMWAQMVNADFIKVEQDGIKMSKNGLEYKFFFGKEDLKFPPLESVKGKLIQKNRGGITHLGANTSLLKTCSDILGINELKFNFYNSPKEAFIAYQFTSRKAYVMIMPCMVQDEHYDITLF